MNPFVLYLLPSPDSNSFLLQPQMFKANPAKKLGQVQEAAADPEENGAHEGMNGATIEGEAVEVSEGEHEEEQEEEHEEDQEDEYYIKSFEDIEALLVSPDGKNDGESNKL